MRYLIVLPLMALAGCSLGGKAPRQLFTLQAASVLPVDSVRAATEANSLTVLVPTTSVAIAGSRIPVYQAGNAVAYVKDAAWIDAPARQFQQILAETISARTQRVVLDPRQATVTPSTIISGTLVMFGVDATTSQAVVTFDAQRNAGSGRISTRRFEARVPVAVVDAASASTALNQAANSVAADVAGWLG